MNLAQPALGRLLSDISRKVLRQDKISSVFSPRAIFEGLQNILIKPTLKMVCLTPVEK
jgi:hypothetical protein